MNAASLQKFSGQRGQATSELLLLVIAITFAVVGIEQGARHYCIEYLAGELKECEGGLKAVSMAFTSAVEEVTFLINLPF